MGSAAVLALAGSGGKYSTNSYHHALCKAAVPSQAMRLYTSSNHA